MKQIELAGLRDRVGRIFFWFLLPPVYLFLRNKRLVRPQLTFWLWFVSIIVATIIDIGFMPD